MKNLILEHRGYAGSVAIDSESDQLYGKVLRIEDAVFFQGGTTSELKQCFISAVDDYIETCAELGKQPQDPAQMILDEQINEVHDHILFNLGAEYSDDYVMFFTDKEYTTIDVNQAQRFLEIGLPVVSITDEYVLCRRGSNA